MKDLKDKAINIKGKQYVQVKDRILALAEDGNYSINTEYEYFDERKMWVVKATLTYNGQTYTGLAQEVESEDYKQVNHSSALENCETSAVGRACAMAGIGVLDSIASVDEINKANNSQSNYAPKGEIANDIQCQCGGQMERLQGISRKNNKPYSKLTCQSCGQVNWENV